MTDSDITIGPAGPDFSRWAEVHALLMQSFAYMKDRIDPPSSMNRLTLEGLIEKSGTEIALIGTEDGSPVACAFLDPRADCLYVGKVAVAPHLRGRGLTRRMFDIAEAEAQRRGLPFLELQTRIELLENHETFRRLGFEKCGEDAHEGYDRPTSIRMRKPVGPQPK